MTFIKQSTTEPVVSVQVSSSKPPNTSLSFKGTVPEVLIVTVCRLVPEGLVIEQIIVSGSLPPLAPFTVMADPTLTTWSKRVAAPSAQTRRTSPPAGPPLKSSQVDAPPCPLMLASQVPPT